MKCCFGFCTTLALYRLTKLSVGLNFCGKNHSISIICSWSMANSLEDIENNINHDMSNIIENFQTWTSLFMIKKSFINTIQGTQVCWSWTWRFRPNCSQEKWCKLRFRLNRSATLNTTTTSAALNYLSLQLVI